MKRLALVVACFLLMISIAWAGTTVTLAWNPNSESDLAGYRVYQDDVLQVPDILCPANDASCCEWESEVLLEGSYSWYAVAFDSDGNISEPSNIVTYNVDLTAPGAPSINITVNVSVNVTP